MENEFSTALQYALRFEGGYSNDPVDPGGATNKGITQKTYDGFRLRRGVNIQSVEAITEQEVVQIYHDEYWVKFNCAHLPSPLSIAVFDFCVNAGANGAKRLQRTLGVKTIDGIIGNRTLAAVREFCGKSQKRTLDLVTAYQRSRKAYYYSIVTRKPSQVRFIKGWMNRVNQLNELLGVKG